MCVKILIVDDEILQLNLISRIIARYRPDYQITVAHDPKEALALMREGDFNALMTDVKMPGMDGIELIRQVRGLGTNPLEIIILSGFDDFQYARSAITFNVLEYLLKPIDGGSLQRVLQKLDEKLAEEYGQLRMQSDYQSLAGRQRATALLKKCVNLPLSAQEADSLSAFGDRLRLILVEETSDIDALLAALPADTCVEELAQDGYLLFMPVPWGALGELPKPPERGLETVGLPCAVSELPKRWRELREYADTARKLELRFLVQEATDETLLEIFTEDVRRQHTEALSGLVGDLRAALITGRLTMSKLAEAARTELAAQANGGRLRRVYPCRKEDLSQVLSREIERCDTPEDLCATIAALQTAPADKEDVSDGFMDSALIYIEAHYSGECSLNAIAQAFHYSISHFSRRFSAFFGTTYTRYLSEYRLEKARELLLQTDAPIREIAQRVGIGDSGYLIRQFSNKYHMSPNKYRQAMAKTPEG